MVIYIASSWKNQHAIEMLTEELRELSHEVHSFAENNYDEGHGPNKPMYFEQWIYTKQALKNFDYDTRGAIEFDLVIYISPSGNDAWAEVGAAWAKGIPVLGLWSKGEQVGLMRHMVKWFVDYRDLLKEIGRA